jgi:hypothetical protein
VRSMASFAALADPLSAMVMRVRGGRRFGRWRKTPARLRPLQTKRPSSPGETRRAGDRRTHAICGGDFATGLAGAHVSGAADAFRLRSKGATPTTLPNGHPSTCHDAVFGQGLRSHDWSEPGSHNERSHCFLALCVCVLYGQCCCSLRQQEATQ